MATLVQLAFAFTTVVVTVVIHLLGLVLIMRLLEAGEARAHRRTRLMHMMLMGAVVCCLFALHLTEIGIYAVVYWVAGAVTPFDVALYFSATTFTTIGYGDVTVAGPWRLFAALEGLTGITLAGWSVAFLITVVRRLELWQRTGQQGPSGD